MATTTPSPAPSAVAAKHATDLVPVYLTVIDKLYSDPTVALDKLHDVATDPELSTEASAIGNFRAAGDHQTGQVRLVATNVTSIDLSNKPSASPRILPTVQIAACVDVSGVEATNAAGKSLVPADRPPYLLEHLTIVNLAYPSSNGWRVSESPNEQVQSCG